MKNHVQTVFDKAERFANITEAFIISGNISRAKKCLAIADRLLLTGSKETKSVISNIYVHSVSTFLELRHCNIAKLFPQALKVEYRRHINATSV